MRVLTQAPRAQFLALLVHANRRIRSPLDEFMDQVRTGILSYRVVPFQVLGAYYVLGFILPGVLLRPVTGFLLRGFFSYLTETVTVTVFFLALYFAVPEARTLILSL